MLKKKILPKSIFTLFLLTTVSWAQAGVIMFDEVPGGNIVTNQYSALGVTFTGVCTVRQGNSNGDPGGWGLEGTNGPYFCGIQADQLVTVTFDSTVTSLSLDTSRSNGSNVGNTFTLEAYFEGGLVDSETIVQEEVNNWTTVVVNGGLDEIRLTSDDGARPVYGIDNICWDEDIGSCTAVESSVPVPTMSNWSLALLAGLVALFGLAVFRRTV